MSPAGPVTFDLPPLDELLPQPYESYAEPIRAALKAFVAHLPADRQVDIVAAQAALGANAEVHDRLVALLRAAPTLHKIGQTLSRDARLSQALRRELTSLESLPARPMALTERERLASLASSNSDFELESDETLAEGSVAVVVPVRWKPAPFAGTRAVIKLLKPGIEQVIANDLSALHPAAEAFETACNDQRVDVPDVSGLLTQIATLLERETQLDRERSGLAEAARQLRTPGVHVPRPLPLESSDSLAMTRVFGATLGTRLRDLRTRARATLSGRLFEATAVHPLLRARGEALFHGDLHAGNILVTVPAATQDTDDGKTEPVPEMHLLDWSQSGQLSKEARVALVRLVTAGVTLNPRRLRASVDALSTSSVDSAALETITDDALREIRSGRPPGISWVLGVLDRAVLEAGAKLPEDLILLRKSWLSLHGVLADLDPLYSTEIAMLLAVVGRAVADTPRRLLALPWSRAFGTHLSNLDVLRLSLSAAGTTRRFWQQTLSSRP